MAALVAGVLCYGLRHQTRDNADGDSGSPADSVAEHSKDSSAAHAATRDSSRERGEHSSAQSVPGSASSPKNQSSDQVRDNAKSSSSNPGSGSRQFDSALATDFAIQISQATGLLAAKYHRELDQNQLMIWAVDGLYRTTARNMPDAIERRLREIGTLKEIDRFTLLADARAALGDRPDLADHKDVTAALKDVFSHLDEHTVVLDSDAMARLRWAQNNAGLGEIGVQVRRRPNSGAVEVLTPYKDGPAYKEGIQSADVITQLKVLDGPDGMPLAEPVAVATDTLTEDDLDHVLRGRPKTRIELAIRRPSQDKPLAFVVSRAWVKKEKLLGVKRQNDDTWDHLLDPTLGIYYVRLLDFQGPETAKELDRLLADFEKQKLGGLVLDLRFAGSGLIQTAADIADLFIDKGVIVEFHKRGSGLGPWKKSSRPGHLQFPMACLVNAETGACTEIVAACLQDHERAVIVGERTAGKASAQNYFPFDGGTLRITTSFAYRPSGLPLDKSQATPESPHVWGVTPDSGLAVPLAPEARAALRENLLHQWIISPKDGPQKDTQPAFKDVQLERALEFLREKGKGS
jgi:C-terminal peptidase prc